MPPNLYRQPEIYDAVFRSLNSQQIRFLASVFSRYRPGGVKVLLEPACGNGRLALGLAGGYHVIGFDRSRKAIAYAQQLAVWNSGCPATFFIGDLRAFTLPPGSVPDAAYCLTCTLNELPTMADFGRHLRAVRRSLAPGGLYVFDVAFTLPDGPHAVGTATIDGRPVEWHAEVSPARGRLARWAQWLTYTIDGRPFAPVVLRRRQPAAVARAIAAAGFAVADVLEGYSLRPLAQWPGADGCATFVCRAPGGKSGPATVQPASA